MREMGKMRSIEEEYRIQNILASGFWLLASI
jgi:hypothetical protein